METRSVDRGKATSVSGECASLSSQEDRGQDYRSVCTPFPCSPAVAGRILGVFFFSFS